MKDYSPNSDRFDLSTFWGRFQHFVCITSPFSLIHSDEDVLRSKKIIEDYARNPTSTTYSSAQLWEHSYITKAAIHPSGDIIPKFCRVSAIAPVNIPIVWGMIACPPSNVTGTLALHFINQSYNTACNYCNRAGGELDMKELAKAYVLAVTSACGLAFGFGRLVANGPPIMKRIGILIPCIATSAANISNLALTRFEEISKGCPVYDDTGFVHGNSKIAGLDGVVKTSLTRAVLVPISCLLLPPIGQRLLSRLGFMPKSATASGLIELSLVYASLQIALPAALAVFPQTSIFRVTDLEESFQGLQDKYGKEISRLYSNKGL